MVSKVNLGYDGEGKEIEVYAAGHRDKKPMLVVSTCGMLLPGPKRTRHRYKYSGGQLISQKWTLDQPHMFAVYRANFNAVDRMNKMSLGRNSIVNAIGTKTWWKRCAIAALSMAVQNAY
jgi:hypothetical protein